MGGERRRRGVGPSHGSGETQVRQPGNVKSPAIQDVGRKYPSGKRLRPVEFAVSKQHRPRDPVSGKPICWILTRCTASARGCPFCPHREMKQWGLHWVVRAQMARRGGFKGGGNCCRPRGRMDFQSLRATEQQNDALKRKNPASVQNTGGYAPFGGEFTPKPAIHREEAPADSIRRPPPLWLIPTPDTSGGSEMTGQTPDGPPEGAGNNERDMASTPDSPNAFAGVIPTDVNLSDFTQLGDGLRAALFGHDDWLVEMIASQEPLSVELDRIDDKRDLELLFAPSAPLIQKDLHCGLINWLSRHSAMQDGGFEASLADGMKSVVGYGGSGLRQLASEPLANLQCLDRLHAGEGGYAVSFGRTN